MTPYLLAALLFSTSVKVTVTSNAGTTNYTSRQLSDVTLALPTDQYVCTRKALVERDTDEGRQVLVVVTCSQHGKQIFATGIACKLNAEDSSESLLWIDVSKTEVPNLVTILTGCTTVRAPVKTL